MQLLSLLFELCHRPLLRQQGQRPREPPRQQDQRPRQFQVVPPLASNNRGGGRGGKRIINWRPVPNANTKNKQADVPVLVGNRPKQSILLVAGPRPPPGTPPSARRNQAAQQQPPKTVNFAAQPPRMNPAEQQQQQPMDDSSPGPPPDAPPLPIMDDDAPVDSNPTNPRSPIDAKQLEIKGSQLNKTQGPNQNPKPPASAHGVDAKTLNNRPGSGGGLMSVLKGLSDQKGKLKKAETRNLTEKRFVKQKESEQVSAPPVPRGGLGGLVDALANSLRNRRGKVAADENDEQDDDDDDNDKEWD